MSEFSILKGVTVVILVTFGKIGLLFSVYNISKNYLTFNDSWIDIYKICQSVFFSLPVSIRYRQIFSGGYRTKMKIWSDENEKLVGKFSRASGAQKKGFPNFSPAAGFFRRGGTENR